MSAVFLKFLTFDNISRFVLLTRVILGKLLSGFVFLFRHVAVGPVTHPAGPQS